MRIPRIYQATPLSLASPVELNSAGAKHLIKVLRLVKGANITLFNGEGGEYPATLVTVEKNKVIAQLNSFIDDDKESPLKIFLGQAISRSEKMDYTVQKAVELGVKQITPLLTERCGVKLSPDRWQKKLEHWRAIAVSACEQSGRNRVPMITEPLLLSEWIAQLGEGLRLMLNPQGNASLRQLSIPPSLIYLLIGSEGGFTPTEIELAESNSFTNLKLGPRVLRTETASVAAIAVLQSYFGDFSLNEG